MAQYYLINTVHVGTTKHFPGELIDSNQHDVTAIENAGGVLWPTGNTVVDAAAAKAQTARIAGRNETELESIMQSAAQKVQRSGDTDAAAQDALDAVAYPARIRALQVIITQALIAAKGVVASGTFDSATAFPAGARLLGVEGDVTTKLQNVGDTDATTYEVGTDGAGKSAIGIAASTSADAGISGGALGAGRAVGGEKLRVTITTDTTLNLISAGGMTVTVLYSVPAAS
jgi:hypothetical protein